MGNDVTPVLIAGGGPVGMTLALELAHRGVRSLLVEQNSTTTRHPKMDLTNGRSMELFRRLGIADELRAAGVPSNEPLDIVWVTSATGQVLHRFAYPSPDTQRDLTRIRNDGIGTLEPSLRVSQVMIEPVLKQAIDNNPLVDVRFGWAFKSLAQDENGVTAVIENGDQQDSVTATFVAGCDGGGSTVRQAVGIELEGQFAVADAYMVHFRSTAYDVLAKFGIAYHLQSEMGTIIAQNGKDIWTLQAMAPPEADPDALLQAFVGQDFDYEILVANPWQPHVVLANRYREDRVFLAGDAAHQLVPTGGYGMNTGIADAVDLGWKLAANLNGWGGAGLLDSYELERQPIGARNLASSLEHVGVRGAISMEIAKAKAAGDLESDDAADRRNTLREFIAQAGNAENESWGIEHGYSYQGSPVICNEQAPADLDPLQAPAYTAPGFRLPNVYLANGSAVFDHLGDGFSLITIGAGSSGGGNDNDCETVAKSLGMPLKTLSLELEPALGVYGHRVMLVRPDQHIAWSGDTPPENWREILAKATGQ